MYRVVFTTPERHARGLMSIPTAGMPRLAASTNDVPDPEKLSSKHPSGGHGYFFKRYETIVGGNLP